MLLCIYSPGICQEAGHYAIRKQTKFTHHYLVTFDLFTRPLLGERVGTSRWPDGCKDRLPEYRGFSAIAWRDQWCIQSRFLYGNSFHFMKIEKYALQIIFTQFQIKRFPWYYHGDITMERCCIFCSEIEQKNSKRCFFQFS